MLTACCDGARPWFVTEHLVELAVTLSGPAVLHAWDGLRYLVGLDPGRARAIRRQAGLGDRPGLRLFCG